MCLGDRGLISSHAEGGELMAAEVGKGFLDGTRLPRCLCEWSRFHLPLKQGPPAAARGEESAWMDQRATQTMST